LATFTVNDTDVVDGDTVNLDYGTESVDVVVETTDPDATYEVNGDSGLVSGDNDLVVTVTAADGETTQDYTVTLTVALNSDTSLATFTVNGTDVVDGDSVTLDPYTTEVEVVVETTDADATYEVNGGTDLVVGDNDLVVTVTAADGETTQDYTVTLTVPAGNDVSLATFQVNGNDVADGDSVEVEYGTESVDVSVETTDPEATYEITGDSGLVQGENALVVTVTAADGETTQDYTVTVIVRGSNDTSLAIFTVNGVDVADGDNVDLEPLTTSVEVVVETTEAGATFEIVGGTDLQPGENSLVVTVTAADGETTQDYTVTLTVALNTDTSLATFQANGNDVQDGDSITLPPYTESIDILATPTDANANVEVTGADALLAGDNTVTVTVTAADGETIQEYTLTVTVELSAENRVSEILVDGQVALDNDVILASDPTVTEVEVAVTTVDENATFEITGNTDLIAGDNLISIVVTAPNGDERTYTVTFRTKGLSGNAKLKTLLVGGSNIDLTSENASVSLPAGSKYVSVIAMPEDSSAAISVSGNKALSTGSNSVTVAVTAPDGKTVKQYVVTVEVASLSTNTNLTSISVNGSIVTAGSTVTLVAGSRYAEVIAVAEDSSANIQYLNNKNLVNGNNSVTIRVTSAAGATRDYDLTLVVPTLSNDTTLKTFTIEGFNVLGKGKLSVIPGTTKLHVSAQATNSGASVSISGRDIHSGVNEVVVTVTAADGTSQTYTVRVKA
jgi:hypothetical protein